MATGARHRPVGVLFGPLKAFPIAKGDGLFNALFTWQSETDMMGPMDVTQALQQIDEIRHHLGRNEIYRGYRSTTIALTGVTGVLAAGALASFWPEADSFARVGFWVAVAMLNLALVA